MDWVITIPKTIAWKDYQRELATVADRTQVMNYRVRFIPKDMSEGDRCFIVHDGRVRGWMEIVGLIARAEPWTCTTTGTRWPAGNYIQRSGPFTLVDGPEYTGFRGVRKFPAASRVAARFIQGPAE